MEHGLLYRDDTLMSRHQFSQDVWSLLDYRVGTFLRDTWSTLGDLFLRCISEIKIHTKEGLVVSGRLDPREDPRGAYGARMVCDTATTD